MTDEVDEVLEINTQRTEGEDTTDLGGKSIAELLGEEDEE